MRIRCATSSQELALQVGWDNEKSETQRWKDRLRERANVDYTAVAVEAVKARKWACVISKFAIVIVFDYPGTSAARPFQKRQSPDHAHGHSKRELIGWRYIRHPCIWRL